MIGWIAINLLFASAAAVCAGLTVLIVGAAPGWIQEYPLVAVLVAAAIVGLTWAYMIGVLHAVELWVNRKGKNHVQH